MDLKEGYGIKTIFFNVYRMIACKTLKRKRGGEHRILDTIQKS